MATVHLDYASWKKNSPALYDALLSHALEWPSLTIEFLPSFERTRDGDLFHAILGTNANHQQNYLLLLRICIPRFTAAGATSSSVTSPAVTPLQNHLHVIPTRNPESTFIEVVQKIPVESEINRARFMPQNPNLIACHMGISDLHCYDLSAEPFKPYSRSTAAAPLYALKGHKQEGYGMAWSPHTHNAGLLISGGNDKIVCAWNVEQSSISSETTPTTTLDPLLCFTNGHSDTVEDVAFSCHDINTIGSVGDDGRMILYDLRVDSKSNSAGRRVVSAHKAEVNSIAFSPTNEFLILTASSDETVAMWDSRYFKASTATTIRPLRSFAAHTSQVYNASWHPTLAGVFASCGEDGRVCIWDATLTDSSSGTHNSSGVPPELMFVHGGHTAKVSDFAWFHDSTGDQAAAGWQWLMASVSDDSLVQVWEMNSKSAAV